MANKLTGARNIPEQVNGNTDDSVTTETTETNNPQNTNADTNGQTTEDTKSDVRPVMVNTRKEKMITVKTNKHHRCVIGGIVYEFEKGVSKEVPVFVKMMLSKQNLLKA